MTLADLTSSLTCTEPISRRPLLPTLVALMDSLTGSAATYAIYHLIEAPIRRAARRIAFSGHWSY